MLYRAIPLVFGTVSCKWAPENRISPAGGQIIWILSGSTSSCGFGCSRVSELTCLVASTLLLLFHSA